MSPSGTLQALTEAQSSQLERVLRLLQAGRADEALEFGKELAAQAARAPDALQLLAMCHGETGNSDEAEQAFLRALELAPNHPLILVNYATMLRKAGRFDAALAVLRRATGMAPDFAQAWSELGNTALRAGHLQQALVAFKRAVALQPDSVLAWHGLGSASRATGDLDAAESAFQRAIALDPQQRSAHINLGAVLRLSGRPDEAIACYERVGKSRHHSPDLADALVGALVDDGRPDEALQLARCVVREHPDFVPGLVTLANLLWEHGPALAPDEHPFDPFRTAIHHQPNHHALRAAYVQVLLSARAAEEALGQLRTLRRDADDPVLALAEANALEMLGRTQLAGALFVQLHNDWGCGDPVFLNAYTRHLLRAGMWDAAAKVAAEATLADPGNQEAWAYLGTAWRLLGDPREGWLCDYDRLIAMVEIEPPLEFAEQSNFLAALTSTLDRRHKACREPVQQSLRGGSQTPGRLFGRQDPVLVAARLSLLRGVERWLATLPTDATHPFLMRNTGRVRIGGSWSAKLWSSGNHVNHIHPEGWISSAFYVALPPSIGSSTAGGQSGFIQFGQPPRELELGLAPRRVLRPEPGKLALFPSYMWHGTVPFDDVQPRVTIAFDMTPLGSDR